MEDLFAKMAGSGVFVLRLLVAMFLGGLIGLERQVRGRPAGLRTNILVCLGSAAVIVAFQKLSVEFTVGAESAIRLDPARAAAGVITGIGFLGAGTIIKSSDFVRGLTTAASIWVVSAVGVTVGLGEYTIATALTLLVLLALYALHNLPIQVDRYYSLQLEWQGDPDLLRDVAELLLEEDVVIKHREITRHPGTGECLATLALRVRHAGPDPTALERLLSDPRFVRVTWS